MAPTPDSTSTASRRQSCDRCHSQKLRCTRAGNSNTGACNRCLRQGAQCVYSFSLPKGRPSMYRLADASRTASHPPATPAVRNTTPPISPEPRRRNTTTGSPPTLDDAKTNVNTNANASGGDNSSNHSPANSSKDTILAMPIEESTGSASSSSSSAFTCSTSMSASTSTPAWPWMETFDWNDMQIDGSELDTSPSLHMHTMVDTKIDTDTTFYDPFPPMPTWESTGSNEAGAPPSPAHLPRPLHGPDVGIAQLSQLTTRLYPLHRASCNLAETAGSTIQPGDHSRRQPTPLIDNDAVFKSVAAWLGHAPYNMNMFFQAERPNPALETTTLGDTLIDAFSTSRHLLEILRSLQVDMGFWACLTPQFTPSSSLNSSSPSIHAKGSPPGYSRPSSQYSNIVIRHLVNACHTMLLSIYVSALTVLQHDVDLRSSNLPAGTLDLGARVDLGLAGMRLVMIVQLCFYLVERQCEAVDLYLSPQSPSQPSQPYDFSGLHQLGVPALGATNQEAKELEIEVQQRMVRLRQMLRL